MQRAAGGKYKKNKKKRGQNRSFADSERPQEKPHGPIELCAIANSKVWAEKRLKIYKYLIWVESSANMISADRQDGSSTLQRFNFKSFDFNLRPFLFNTQTAAAH